MFHVMGHPGAYTGDGAVATTLKLSCECICERHASNLYVLESVLVNWFEYDGALYHVSNERASMILPNKFGLICWRIAKTRPNRLVKACDLGNEIEPREKLGFPNLTVKDERLTLKDCFCVDHFTFLLTRMICIALVIISQQNKKIISACRWTSSLQTLLAVFYDLFICYFTYFYSMCYYRDIGGSLESENRMILKD